MQYTINTDSGSDSNGSDSISGESSLSADNSHSNSDVKESNHSSNNNNHHIATLATITTTSTTSATTAVANVVPKFIITLSDPVKRCYSDYYFLDDHSLKPLRVGTPNGKSAAQFHHRMESQVHEFQACVSQYEKRLHQLLKVSKSEDNFTDLREDNSNSDSGDSSSSNSGGDSSGYKGPIWFRASQM